MLRDEPRQRRKRVVLLTRDSGYCRLFLQEFLSHADVDLVGILVSSSHLHRGRPWPGDLLRFVRRVGMAYALYQAYVAFVLPWIARTGPGPVDICRQMRIPLLETDDINKPEARRWLQALSSDFILSFHFNQRILDPVAKLPTVAALNFHPSWLPDWRGVDPVLFALLDGSAELGATIHIVSPGLDEGDILLQERFPLVEGGLIGNNCALFRHGGQMAATVLANYDDLYRSRQPQDAAQGCYYGWEQVGQTPAWKIPWKTSQKASSLPGQAPG